MIAPDPTGKYSKRQSSMTRERFPTLLHRLLEDAHADPHNLGRIISWEPCGTGFRILDQRLFTTLIMPRYFASMTHFKSFRRQLNLYGLKQVSHRRRHSLEAANKVPKKKWATMGLPSRKEGMLLDQHQRPIQKCGIYRHPLFQRGNPGLVAILPRIDGKQKGRSQPFDLPEVTPINTDVSEHSNHGNEEMSWSSMFTSGDGTSKINPSPMEVLNNNPKLQYIADGAELVHLGGTPHLSSSSVPCIMSGNDSITQLELAFKTQMADVAIPTTGRINELAKASSAMARFDCSAISMDAVTPKSSTVEDSSPRSGEVETPSPSWLLWEPSPMRFPPKIHAQDKSPKTFDEGTQNDPFHSKEDLRREIIKTFLVAT